MEHQVSNIGAHEIEVVDMSSVPHKVQPGAVWIGRAWKIVMRDERKVEYSVQPVE